MLYFEGADPSKEVLAFDQPVEVLFLVNGVEKDSLKDFNQALLTLGHGCLLEHFAHFTQVSLLFE